MHNCHFLDVNSRYKLFVYNEYLLNETFPDNESSIRVRQSTKASSAIVYVFVGLGVWSNLELVVVSRGAQYIIQWREGTRNIDANTCAVLSLGLTWLLVDGDRWRWRSWLADDEPWWRWRRVRRDDVGCARWARSRSRSRWPCCLPLLGDRRWLRLYRRSWLVPRSCWRDLNTRSPLKYTNKQN